MSMLEQEELAQGAYKAFEKNKKLKVYINRTHSTVKLPFELKKEDNLHIDDHLRNLFLSSVYKPEGSSTYFFKNSAGAPVFINFEVIQKFGEIVGVRFPQEKLVYRESYAVVDKETGIELMKQRCGVAQFESDKFKVDIRVRSQTFEFRKSHTDQPQAT
jgi:hypothetical protein